VFEGIASAGEAALNLANRLPGIVHKLKCGYAPFFDGDVVFGAGSWPMISSLAALHGDAVVHFMTVEPEARYFLEAAGHCGAFSTPVGADSDVYAAGLFGSDLRATSGKIAYTAEVAALFGNSGRWGIWSERGVIGLLATEDPGAIAEWEIAFGPFLSVEDALDGILRVNFGGAAVPEEFAAALERNYGAFGTTAP